MSIDLEPCPFCGSEAIETRDTETTGGTYVWHVCGSCGCETEGADGHQAAADQWNRRAPTAAARERDALREALWAMVEHFERVDGDDRHQAVIRKATQALRRTAGAVR